MASWFTRALDRITPWDRKGEVQRRQESQKKRKRRDEEQSQAPRQSIAPQQTSFQDNTQQEQKRPDILQPRNLFGTIDTSMGGLDMPKPQQPQRPQVAQGRGVLRPEVYNQKNAQELRNQAQQIENRIPRPQQSLANKVRDVFDANTEADQRRRAIRDANTRATINRLQGRSPEESVDRGVNYGRITGQSPHRTLVDDARELNTSMIRGAATAPSALGRIITGVGEGVTDLAGFAGTAVNAPIQLLRKGTVRGSSDNLLANSMREVRDRAISPVSRFMDRSAEAIGGEANMEAYRKAQIAGEIVAGVASLGALSAAKAPKVAQAFKLGDAAETSKLGKVARFLDNAINSPIKSVRDSFRAPNAVRSTPDIGDVLNQADIDDITRTTQIPVRENPTDLVRDITANPVDNRIPVRTPDRLDTPLIREAGDVPQTPNTARERLQEAQSTKAKSEFDAQQDINKLPDSRIEGVSPRSRTEGVTRSEIEIEKSRLDDALANNEINKTQHKAAMKELEGNQAIDEAPKGDRVEVREVRDIPVVDETNVPQGLPEAPGTVRATVQTDNQARATQMVAEQPPIAPRNSKGEGVAPEGDRTSIASRQADDAGNAKAETGDSMDKAYERLVKSLEENRKSYKVEKKIKKAEAARRSAEKQRIYDELVSSGMSRFEAERQANKALAGKYTRNTVDNFDVTGGEAETFRKAIDDYQQSIGDRFGNTKKAFEHMIDPNRTDPLRDWERTEIRRFVQHKLGDEAATALDEALAMTNITGDTLLENRISSFMTGAIAAGDISAVGRQGLFGWVNHPKMSSKALTDSLGALVDPKKERAFMSDLVRDPDTAFFQQNMKSKYQTLTDVADEARGKDTTNRLTSWYVNPSNRQYNVYLDSLRHQQRKAILEKFGGQEGFLAAAKAKNPKNPDKWMEAWEKVIGNMSGRGMATKGADLSVQDAQVLFSVRNLASRFAKLTSPVHFRLLRDNPQAYLHQLKETATGLGAIGTTLAVAGASGLVDVENGKIKVGPTRIDVSGGLATIVNSAQKVVKYVSGQSDGPFAPSGGEIITDFMRNQLSPVLGTIGRLMDVNWAEGKDKYGNEIDPMWFTENVAPLPAVLGGVISSVSEGLNPLETGRNAVLEGIGFNTNVYQSADDKKQQKEADLRAQYGGDPAIDSSRPIEEQIKDTYGTGLAGIANRVRDVFDANTPADQLKRAAEDARTGANTGFAKYIPEGTTELTQKVLSGVIDDAYYENDWDALVQARQVALDRLKNDGNSKRSERDTAELELKRANFYKDNDYTSSDIDEYYDVGVTEWRKMGYPPGHRYHDPDIYNPELQEKLWQIDEAMAQAGVSFVKNKPDKQKYSLASGSTGSGRGRGRGRGRGGSGGSKLSTEFGKLGSASSAPKIREYSSIPTQQSSVPIIRRTRPNIVHRISTRGYN